MTPQPDDLDAAWGQCKATIWAGPNSYHCAGDVGHDGWHRFVVDEEGITLLAHVRAVVGEKDKQIAAKDTALDFAEGAIDDAIYTDDGLDGTAGEKVLSILREAREHGTFDKEPFDRSTLPSVMVETLRAAIAERDERIAKYVEAHEWNTRLIDPLRAERELLIKFNKQHLAQIERLQKTVQKYTALAPDSERPEKT